MKKITILIVGVLSAHISVRAQHPTTYLSVPQQTGAHDAYGSSVSIGENTVVVGAPMTDITHLDNGAVWIYPINNTTLGTPQKLLPPTYQVTGCFGNEVALQGNHLLIGAYGINNKAPGSGVVYYYHFNGSQWELLQTLSASDAGGGDRFGHSIAIDGNTAVIGAPGSSNSRHPGKAYIFRLNNMTWTEETHFTLSERISMHPAFGWDVAVQNNLVAVSALYANSSKPQTGKVILYRNMQGNWKTETELAPADGNKWDLFGTDIAIDDERVLVGAPNNAGIGTTGKKTGAAYLFHHPGTNWIQQSKLTGDAGSNSHDDFGVAVSLDNNLLVIGAGQDDFMGKNTGAAYVFEFTGNSWTQKNKFTGTVNHNDDHYGSALSLKGTQLLSGASLAEQQNGKSNHGLVYFYTGINMPILYNDIIEHAVDAGNGTNINFYPNPFADQATLQIRTKQLIHDVSIYDMLGRFVTHPETIEQHDGSFTYSVKGDFPAGQYILNMKLSDGTKNLLLQKQ
jgi:hypothetical protein